MPPEGSDLIFDHRHNADDGHLMIFHGCGPPSDAHPEARGVDAPAQGIN
jgi:hypothetical protein